MHLTPAPGIILDLDERFHKEVIGLPLKITLIGSEMFQAIAKDLLASHAPHISITDDGEHVHLLSLEQYGCALLETYLDGKPFLEQKTLLHSIPEALLITYAKKHNIPVHLELKSDLRILLDNLAKEQPQTYLSLAQSTKRLTPHIVHLPELQGQDF